MNAFSVRSQISRTCTKTWKIASKNTLWCLLDCSIEDFCTIAYFQFTGSDWPVLAIMVLAIVNGLITSILRESIILSKQMTLRNAFRTAIGMSFISMIAMETAMSFKDFMLTGGAILTWWVIQIMLFAGYITPLSFNYWRLKALGKGCH